MKGTCTVGTAGQAKAQVIAHLAHPCNADPLVSALSQWSKDRVLDGHKSGASGASDAHLSERHAAGQQHTREGMPVVVTRGKHARASIPDPALGARAKLRGP
jgi:hypothetical protein